MEFEIHYSEDYHIWEKKKEVLGFSALIRWWRGLDTALFLEEKMSLY